MGNIVVPVIVVPKIIDGICYLFGGSSCKPFVCEYGSHGGIDCDPGETAICTCRPEGHPHAECKPKQGRRRSLLQDESQNISLVSLPNTAKCLQTDTCGRMLYGYGIDGDQSPQSRCTEFSCTASELQLFEDTLPEVIDVVECPAEESCIGLFEYFDDEVMKTWDEAQTFCESIDSDLATILTAEQLECACRSIFGSSPWIGMHGDHSSKPYHMVYIDGSICPEERICVDGGFWLNGKPIKCGEGSQCIRLLSEFCKIDNDITCDKTLTAILCNRAGSRSERRRIAAEAGSELLTISYSNDYDILNYGNNAFVMTIIAFAGIVLCILMSFVFGRYCCIHKKKRNHTMKNEKEAIVTNKL